MSAKVGFYRVAQKKEAESGRAKLRLQSHYDSSLVSCFLQCFEANFPFHENSGLYRGNTGTITHLSDWIGDFTPVTRYHLEKSNWMDEALLSGGIAHCALDHIYFLNDTGINVPEKSSFS